MADTLITMVKKFGDMVIEYAIEKYQEGYSFMTDEEHEEHKEDEFDEFKEDIFNTEEHSFHQYMIDGGVTLSTEQILKMLNWNNKYRDENFGDTTVQLDLTEKKIVNLFAYFCACDEKDAIFDKLRFMYCDDEEEEEEEEEA
jgi:hypothetical protein